MANLDFIRGPRSLTQAVSVRSGCVSVGKRQKEESTCDQSAERGGTH